MVRGFLVVSPTVSSFASFLADRIGQSGIVDSEADPESIEPEFRRQAVVSGVWPTKAADEPWLLDRLKAWMAVAPAGIVTACGDRQPPVHRLRRRLEKAGLTVDFAGLADDTETGERVAVVILAGEESSRPTAAPPDFRVVAIMPVFNEADIIVPSLESLIQEGLDVYLLDNWSTDGTERLASRLLGRGLLEDRKVSGRWASTLYDLRSTLQEDCRDRPTRFEADWIVINDADEMRCSPWPGVTLRDAIYAVDQRGFNAIDYTNIIFEPTDDDFRDGASLGHFRHFRFGSGTLAPSENQQLEADGRTWSTSSNPAATKCASTGAGSFPSSFFSSTTQFDRSDKASERVFRERKPRYSDEERALGWHVHYDQIQESESFLRDPATLIEFDEKRFSEEFLIERLSGIGSVPDLELRLTYNRRTKTLRTSAMTGSTLKEDSDHGSKRAEPRSSADSQALGAAEAELADARLRLRESQEREQRLIERVFEAEERLSESLGTEHELRIQIGRYAEFHEAIKRSRAWRRFSSSAACMGREW